MRWWQGILLYITILYIGGPLFIIFPMPGGIYNDIVIRLVTLVIAAIFLLPNPYACRTLFRLRRPLLGWTLAIAAGLTMVSQVTILVAFWTEPDMSGIVHPGGGLGAVSVHRDLGPTFRGTRLARRYRDRAV